MVKSCLPFKILQDAACTHGSVIITSTAMLSWCPSALLLVCLMPQLHCKDNAELVTRTIPGWQVVFEVFEENVRRGSPVYEEGHVLVLAWCCGQRDFEVLTKLLYQVG